MGFARGHTVMDETLPFLTADDAEHVRRLVVDELARAGCPVSVHDGHLAAADGREFGLWNVAALCHGAGTRDLWPDVVGRHVRQVLDPQPDLAHLTTDELLDLTVLRVAAVDLFPEPYLAQLGYATEVVEGLMQVLVADFPTVMTLGDRDVERVGLDRLLAAGRARLLAEPVEHTVVLLEGARLDVLTGDSVYVASKLLVLADVLRSLHGADAYPDGVLVAVPDRHHLLLHVPVDAGVVTALHALTSAAVRLWSTAPGGISPSVYWWRDGALTRVSRLDADGSPAVDVHDDLGALLDRLAAG